MKKQNKDLAIALRHELHQHPELSNQEVRTKARLIRFLKEHTDLEIVDHDTWFYAIHRGGSKKSIAFRADYDALPIYEPRDLFPHASIIEGVSHKCGHDGHASALAGLALEVDQLKPAKDVYFLFQPAEETGDGAIQCVRMLEDNKIDEIFAFHNESGYEKGTVAIRKGISSFASKGLIIEFTGKPSHASQPEFGINPAWAIARIISKLPDLADGSLYDGLVFSTIIQVKIGDWAFGTSAHEGNLLLTIRGLYEKDMEALDTRVRDLVIAEAEKDGLEVKFSTTDYFPETRNHDVSNAKILQVCEKLGLPSSSLEQANRWSEDFGHLTKRVPGAMFVVGNGVDAPELHTTYYDFPDEILEVAVKVFYGLIELE